MTYLLTHYVLCVFVYDDKNLILAIIGEWCGKTADNTSCQPTNERAITNCTVYEKKSPTFELLNIKFRISSELLVPA